MERRTKIYSHKIWFLKIKGEGIVKAHRRSIRSLSKLQNNLDNLDQHPTKLSHPILTKTMVVRITWHIIRAGGAQLFLTIVAKCQEVSCFRAGKPLAAKQSSSVVLKDLQV